ncbi:MAG TPA: DUF4197 domain-containing protein [Flavobacteriales bacterium]|nr:DUF4197 domain-containing protein [Flavobacteriales bacterium]
MKTKFIFPAVFAIVLIGCTVDEITSGANQVLNSGSNTEKGLTNEQVIAGLKEALVVGTGHSSAGASTTDGFFKNAKIALPFPPDAIKVKEKVEAVGFKPQVDKFVLTLNRAAEEAAKEAKPIFTNAITGMTVQDGFAILKGNDNAATKYLEDKTSASLYTAFKPKVSAAIQKVELTKYWEPIINKYNALTALSGGEKINPDLEDYVTKRAMQGLFTLIAEEELKIRKDPVARVTDILKSVFGSLDNK